MSLQVGCSAGLTAGQTAGARLLVLGLELAGSGKTSRSGGQQIMYANFWHYISLALGARGRAGEPSSRRKNLVRVQKAGAFEGEPSDQSRGRYLSGLLRNDPAQYGHSEAHKRVLRVECMPESLILILLSHPDPRLLPHECLPVLAWSSSSSTLDYVFSILKIYLVPYRLQPSFCARILLRFAMSNGSSQSLVFLIDRLNATKLVSTRPLASPAPRSTLHLPLPPTDRTLRLRPPA